MLDELGIDRVEGILLDLGLSSDQLAWEGPGLQLLDRRTARHAVRPEEPGPTAADLVNRLPEDELAKLFFELGEERFSRRIARRIVEERKTGPIRTTGDWPTWCGGASPAGPRHGSIDPATRVFQALADRRQ